MHIGHLAPVEATRDAAALDLVLFVPNWQQPLKPAAPQATASQRLRMLELAIAGNASFRLSDIELRDEQPSFTVDTLDQLQRDWPSAELHFILGVDALNQVYEWHMPHRLLEMYRPIVMLRAGWPGPNWQRLEAIHAEASRLVQVVQVPALAIAASDIRARIASGRSVRYLVPDAVREFIEREHLYESATMPSKNEESTADD